MTIEEEMAKAILETIDVKLSPILERLQKLEKTEFFSREDFEKLCLSVREKDTQVFNAWKTALDRKFAELDKKYFLKNIERVV